MERFIIRILTLLLFSLPAFGQELPPVKAFPSKIYQAGNQNWGISQGPQNDMYFANNEGLVHYDGNNWKLYPSPNKTIMRSVLAVDNRIYTGNYMEFGYWSEGDDGILAYTSLTDKLAGRLIEDEQFWSIQQVDDFVLFQSLDRIYIYDTQADKLETVNTTGVFKMFRLGNTFYLQDNALDFYKIERELASRTDDLSSFKEDRVVALLPSATGTLLLSQTSGFYRLTPGGYEPWATDLDTLAEDLRVYSAIRLNNGNYAIGTVADGLVLLSPEGQLVARYYQSNGLSNNTVLALYEDKDNNLWAGLDNGIDVLNLQAPVKIYTDANGLIGSVYAAEEYQDQLYLGTNQGLFYKPLDSAGPFSRVEGTKGQVWALEIIDETLFCAHDDGIMIIENSKSKLLSSHSGAWTFLKLESSPDKILVGNYQGLSLLEKQEGNWVFSGSLEGFKYSSRFLLEDADGSFWINHEYKGVFKLEIDLNEKKVRSYVRDTTLPLGKNSGAVRYKDQLVYTTEAGVFTKKNGQSFGIDSLLSEAYGMENKYISGQLDVDEQDNLWMFGSNYIKLFGPSSFGRSKVMKDIALAEDYRNQMIGYEQVSNLSSGKHVLGTTSGYLLIDVDKFVPLENTVYISGGTVRSNKGEEFAINMEEAVFKPRFNNFRIYLNTPNYSTYLSKEFRYHLEGYYEQWSNWSDDNSIFMDNLPPGDYILKAESRLGLNPSINQAKFEFTIDAPWYASKLALGIYICLGLIIIFVVNESYRRYYKNQRIKLQQETERQIELELLNIDKERIALEKVNLERDVALKNQELATATMSMARKNEILQAIKKDIDRIDDKDDGQAIKRVKSIIEKSLNTSDDWELFQKAFNNVDKDFIKEIKAKYPKLTPNDLKLCTYLRLNLSSKEIAPLLNISVRSVEISRYRLRKKMGLPTEVNLVDHILSI